MISNSRSEIGALRVRNRAGRRGFTFAEILVSMVFMAIVLPFAMQGLTLANRAGVTAARTRVAAQLADAVLSEALVSESWRDGDAEGDFDEDYPGYRWEITTGAWETDTMRVVVCEVFFTVQNLERSVRLCSLAPESESE